LGHALLYASACLPMPASTEAGYACSQRGRHPERSARTAFSRRRVQVFFFPRAGCKPGGRTRGVRAGGTPDARPRGRAGAHRVLRGVLLVAEAQQAPDAQAGQAVQRAQVLQRAGHLGASDGGRAGRGRPRQVPQVRALQQPLLHIVQQPACAALPRASLNTVEACVMTSPKQRVAARRSPQIGASACHERETLLLHGRAAAAHTEHLSE